MRKRVVPLLLAGCALTACEATRSIFVGDSNASVGQIESPQAADSIYLETMRRLAEADPATQAELFAAAEDAYRRAPTTTHTLRLALAYATPAHPAADPEAAQRLLTEVLANPATLLPPERALAEVALHEVEQRLVLEAEIRQLRSQAQAMRESRDADQAARLQAAMDENRRLKQALQEAEQKLEAVTSIERSIIQRSENGTQKQGNP